MKTLCKLTQLYSANFNLTFVDWNSVIKISYNECIEQRCKKNVKLNNYLVVFVFVYWKTVQTFRLQSYHRKGTDSC